MDQLRVLDGELEHDVLVGQRLVDLGERVQLGLDVDEVLGVEEHFQHLGAIHLISNALANNLSRIYDVIQDSIVNGSQSPGSRARSLLGG